MLCNCQDFNGHKYHFDYFFHTRIGTVISIFVAATLSISQFLSKSRMRFHTPEVDFPFFSFQSSKSALLCCAFPSAVNCSQNSVYNFLDCSGLLCDSNLANGSEQQVVYFYFALITILLQFFLCVCHCC